MSFAEGNTLYCTTTEPLSLLLWFIKYLRTFWLIDDVERKYEYEYFKEIFINVVYPLVVSDFISLSV